MKWPSIEFSAVELIEVRGPFIYRGYMVHLAGLTVIKLYPIAPQNRGHGMVKITTKLIVKINLKTFPVAI